MVVSASTWLDDTVAMAVFRRQILSVLGLATEEKVVRVVVLLVGGTFEVDAKPALVGAWSI